MATDASIIEETGNLNSWVDISETAAYQAEVAAEREAYERHKAELSAWQSKWPEACEECGGWGGQSYSYDPSPAGVSLAPGSMYEFDPCEAPGCVSEGFCARCGKPTLSEIPGVFEEGQGPCKNCGWNYDDGAPQW